MGILHMRKRYVIFIVSVVLVILVVSIFESIFLYQVQTQKMFKITISLSTRNPIEYGDYLWHVSIEQLSYEELKNAHAVIDVNNGMPFPGIPDNRTVDGRPQLIFDQSPQPTNITMVWDGGQEIFLFRDSPIF